MSHDVFVSHSSKDKDAAERICAALEQAGIRVWIAPRDILPGQSWGASIIKAITDCRAMVIILSSASNDSPQVMREVERAVSKRTGIIPVRIENIVPTESMEYFLGTTHWLDAFGPALDTKLKKLVETVQATLAVQPGETPTYKDVPPASTAAPRSEPPAPVHTVPVKLFIGTVAAILIVLLLIAGGAFWVLRHPPASTALTAQSMPSRAPNVVTAYTAVATARTTSSNEPVSLPTTKLLVVPAANTVEAAAVVVPKLPKVEVKHVKKTVAAAVTSSSDQSASTVQAKLVVSPKTGTATNASAAPSNDEPTNPADLVIMAHKYMKGDGVTRDFARAASLYQKAAEQGNAEAEANLGGMYVRGSGVPIDINKGVSLYTKAAKQGNVSAMQGLYLMYEFGRGVPTDYARALSLMKQAANQGNPWAYSALGYIYEQGNGVPRDYNQARYWYLKAVNAGAYVPREDLEKVCWLNPSGCNVN